MAGNKRWTLEDVEYLTKHYGVLPVAEVSKKINRSEDAIHWKASSLGLRFSKKKEFASIVDILKSFEERLSKIEEIIKNK